MEKVVAKAAAATSNLHLGAPQTSSLKLRTSSLQPQSSFGRFLTHYCLDPPTWHLGYCYPAFVSPRHAPLALPPARPHGPSRHPPDDLKKSYNQRYKCENQSAHSEEGMQFLLLSWKAPALCAALSRDKLLSLTRACPDPQLGSLAFFSVRHWLVRQCTTTFWRNTRSRMRC